MPFTDRIILYINEQLKGGSLNDRRFQPARYFGTSTVIARKTADGSLKQIPGIQKGGEYVALLPDDVHAVTLYHKVISNVYTTAAKSHGEGYDYKCVTELALVVSADEKRVRMTPDALEPLLVFGLPQRVSSDLMAETGLRNSLILPLGSDMDKLRVFRQEYPQSDYFLKPNIHLFQLRYKVETTFDRKCVDTCLCGA